MSANNSLQDLRFSNTNMLWAFLMAEVFVRLGGRYAVISPGSRSAPLAIGFALNDRIDTLPALDERSAGFFALGLAKRSQTPVVLICTSGTAAANYYPAVIEARESGVPLLLLTADRPPELRHCHAGQAIDQQKIYGDYPNWYAELSLPSHEPDHLAYLRQTFAYAYERCMFPSLGPVHLNVPFREPLAPVADGATPMTAVQWKNLFKEMRPWVKSEITLEKGHLETEVNALASVKQGLIIVGDVSCESVDAVGALSQCLPWPVLDGGLSSLRNHASTVSHLIVHYDTLLREPALAKTLAPEAVLSIGPLPTSKVLRHWLKRVDVPLWMVEESSRNTDALHGNTRFLRTTLPRLVDQLKRIASAQDKHYTQSWNKHESAITAIFESAFKACDFMFEGKVAWELSRALPEKTACFVANSMPIRDVEYFWQPSDRQVAMYCSRGANGIDGTLSTALGVAHDHSSPAILLTGDLACLHDSNGLLLKTHFKGSLTIVLINNEGGGIFENLPIAQFDPPFHEYFTTPQGVDFESFSALHRIPYYQPQAWDEFTALLSELPDAGIRLIEVKTDRKRDVAWRNALFEKSIRDLEF